MTIPASKNVHVVHYIESESSWGQRVDDVAMFNTYEQASSTVSKFNSKNDKDEVPSWYMYAQQVGEKTIELVSIQECTVSKNEQIYSLTRRDFNIQFPELHFPSEYDSIIVEQLGDKVVLWK